MQRLEYHLTVRKNETVEAELREGQQLTRRSPEPMTLSPNLSVFITQILGGTAAQPRQVIKSIGLELYNLLFTGSIKSHFEYEAWDRVFKQSDRYRLALSLRLEQGLRPEIAALPWEFLYCERGSTFLATDPKVAFSRESTDLKYPTPPPLPASEPLRVMLIHSSPPKLPPVALARLKNVLTELAGPTQGLLPPLILPEPTPEVIEQELSTYRPHILHLLAHGHFEERGSRVALVDPASREAHWYSAESLADVLQRLSYADLPHLLILQACESGQPSGLSTFNPGAAAAFHPYLPAVIAMYYTITNEVGWDFSDQFYRRLVGGEDLDFAVQEGRRYLARANAPDPDSHANRNFGGLLLWLRPGAHRFWDEIAETGPQTITVRITLPDQARVETDLPADTLVHQLLSALLQEWQPPPAEHTSRRYVLASAPSGPALNPADTLAEAGVRSGTELALLAEPLTPDSPVSLTLEDAQGHHFMTAVTLKTAIRHLAELFLQQTDSPGQGPLVVELVGSSPDSAAQRPLSLNASLYDEGVGDDALLRIYRPSVQE